MTPSPKTVVDTAGAHQGGAARFLQELEDHLSESELGSTVHLLGKGRSLSPTWLIRREARAARAVRRIALNNASFSSGAERVVLLRNALHFMLPGELDSVPMDRHRDIRLQTPIIRALARRADLIIVPSSHMAERVAHYLPRVSDRLEVRFHPVTTNGRRAHPLADDSEPGVFLMPIIKSPFKRLDDRINVFLEAARRLPRPVQLWVTAEPHEYPGDIRNNPIVKFIGRHPSRRLQSYWESAHATYFPTAIESFGYALAEARSRGVPVVALDSALSREIGGDALCAVAELEPDELTEALQYALNKHITPDPLPFSAQLYFDRLFHREI